MRDRAIGVLALLAAGMSIACPRPVLAVSAEEQKEICAEAEKRYLEMFGKPPSNESAAVVTMYKHTFCPPELTVKAGSRVRFVNVDKRTSHSFWFKDAGHPESERFFSGEGAEMVIDLPPGEHTYLCGPHWDQEKMIGRLIVVP